MAAYQCSRKSFSFSHSCWNRWGETASMMECTPALSKQNISPQGQDVQCVKCSASPWVLRSIRSDYSVLRCFCRAVVWCGRLTPFEKIVAVQAVPYQWSTFVSIGMKQEMPCRIHFLHGLFCCCSSEVVLRTGWRYEVDETEYLSF